jgi:hypothetical protein
MDIDSNPIGVDYRAHIDESLKRCDMLLAVIGPKWLGTGGAGARRIDDPSDLVRLEVSSALTRGIRVVPILIDETEMPDVENLPEELKGLKFRQAFRVDSGVDFHHHLDRLCSAMAAASGQLSKATDAPPPLRAQPDKLEAAGSASPGPVGSPKGENEARRIKALALESLACSILGPILSYLIIGASHLNVRAFICCLLGFAVGAIICGHRANRLARQNPSLPGRNFALIALSAGYFLLVAAAFLLIAHIHDSMMMSRDLSDAPLTR